MGGQETLLLAAPLPQGAFGGYRQAGGAGAFDSTSDLATQCAYLTNRTPVQGSDPAGVAARMIEEINREPGLGSRLPPERHLLQRKG
jgi:hypothetical protein